MDRLATLAPRSSSRIVETLPTFPEPRGRDTGQNPSDHSRYVRWLVFITSPHIKATVAKINPQNTFSVVSPIMFSKKNLFESIHSTVDKFCMYCSCLLSWHLAVSRVIPGNQNHSYHQKVSPSWFFSVQSDSHWGKRITVKIRKLKYLTMWLFGKY